LAPKPVLAHSSPIKWRALFPGYIQTNPLPRRAERRTRRAGFEPADDKQYLPCQSSGSQTGHLATAKTLSRAHVGRRGVARNA
jgi:hypothetical protein